MSSAEMFTLPAGTLCKRNGIPFALMHATQIECGGQQTFALLSGEPPSENSPQSQSLSHLEPDSLKPRHAAGALAVSTSSSSDESRYAESRSRTSTGVSVVSTNQVESK